MLIKQYDFIKVFVLKILTLLKISVRNVPFFFFKLYDSFLPRMKYEIWGEVSLYDFFWMGRGRTES